MVEEATTGMIIKPPYAELENLDKLSIAFQLQDHLYGFDADGTNYFLKRLNKYAESQDIKYQIGYHNVLEHHIHSLYPNLDIKLFSDWQNRLNLDKFLQYTQHPEVNYKNFICSFNGTEHVSRKLLVAILEKFNYFSIEHCSKNIAFSVNTLDGHIQDLVGDQHSFYRKFFISDHSEKFFQSINSFGHVQQQHDKNIYNLESKITQSFLHVVSESMATSHVPFVTEKFLYSVVTRGLFLTYAQPGWHTHVEKYYGFKLYDKLFDYRFDAIQNPVERLVELMSMISKFSILTADEWMDLYHLEQDTIEYNYDHYFSGAYIRHLKTYEN